MKPFQYAEALPGSRQRAIESMIAVYEAAGGKMTAAVRATIEETVDDENNATLWINDTHQVAVRIVADKHGDEWIWLSIKRLDREPIHDWRELQEVKNHILGPEREAVELYPAESRLVDTANQYHLWAPQKNERFPFGFGGRAVTPPTRGSHSKQRPLKN